MITNFPEFDNESMGGNFTFQFIPVKYTQSMPENVGSVVASLPTPITGKAILNGLAIMDTLTFNEKQATQDAGDYFTTEIKGFVPKMDSTTLSLFNEMRRHRHIVMITDNNGKLRVCGTLNNGMEFKFDQDTKDTPAGSNGYSFIFTGKSTEPSPHLINS